MSQVPENAVTQADLAVWYKLNEELKRLKGQEALLRQKIFKGMFLNPHEGTNSVDLPDGYVLKGKHNINRDIDPGALDALRPELKKAKILVDQLVRYKPELKIALYRELTDEQRQLFDQALIIKDGMPGLEIVMPKRRT